MTVPIRLARVQGLLEFLAYEPFYDGRAWGALLLRRGEAGPQRLLPLCSLLRGVMLRRTKDDVGTPDPWEPPGHTCWALPLLCSAVQPVEFC